ncbi:MAG: hypothetical protein GWQ05_15515 [Verrucomicrobiaceae bacterium]|nr:hypothetical protein [Verrucomicrobiaceae bacterium]
MTTLLTISFLLVAGSMFAKFLTEWLSNRPEPGSDDSPEDILAEMEAAFVQREILTFTVHTNSVGVMLHRLTEAVGLGFGTRQAETLAYRISNQPSREYFSAVYPVEVNSISSDLEFQWCREEEWTARIAICAVDDVITFATDAIADLVIEQHS